MTEVFVTPNIACNSRKLQPGRIYTVYDIEDDLVYLKERLGMPGIPISMLTQVITKDNETKYFQLEKSKDIA